MEVHFHLKKYTHDIKLNAVDVIEKRKSKNSVAKSIGACPADIRKWVRLYQNHGENGLKNTYRTSRQCRRSVLFTPVFQFYPYYTSIP
jgi:transposase-like protein